MCCPLGQPLLFPRSQGADGREVEQWGTSWHPWDLSTCKARALSTKPLCQAQWKFLTLGFLRLFIFLTRESGEKDSCERPLICWFTSQIPTTYRAGPASQKLGTPGIPEEWQKPTYSRQQHGFTDFTLAGSWSQVPELVLKPHTMMWDVTTSVSLQRNTTLSWI